MLTVKERDTETQNAGVQKHDCYHCGIPCLTDNICIDDKYFCCQGCKLVYEVLNQGGLCNYYNIEQHPGLTQIKPLRREKYAYLDNDDIAAGLYTFTDGQNCIVTLQVPGVHCSSCMWLLEHMHRLNAGITSSRLNFSARELTVHFNKKHITLRQLAELLATIGYEPHISLEQRGVQDDLGKAGGTYDKGKVYKLGIAGFCFGNIMLLSFPEYLGDFNIEPEYAALFRIINLVLGLPVFFYCASEFFISAWKGLKQGILNIDLPVVLALIITFTRSIYEIATGTGAGYFDSMSGIVFFMLIGRIVQERTFGSINFHRNYKAYFPIAATVKTEEGTVAKNIEDLKRGDVVQVYSDELIPADGILLEGRSNIDYSFVSGESEPVFIERGDMVYAGGRQRGDTLLVQVNKPVRSSYLTQLWNHHAFKKDKQRDNDRQSAVHVLSRYFTYILFTLATITALYWWRHDTRLIIPSVSAMLIVACPCALLLSATYTNGNILRIMSNNGLFMRDATIIEQLGKVDSIVFDKTGTLMHNTGAATAVGDIPAAARDVIGSMVARSRHPNSVAIARALGKYTLVPLDDWQEHAGLGLSALAGGCEVRVGSAAWTNVKTLQHCQVYAVAGGREYGFTIEPELREGAGEMLSDLGKNYKLSLLSGDNSRHADMMERTFGNDAEMLFNQKPMDKLHYVERLQEQGEHVLMVGDGLNDAGALQQSNVGITLADDVNNFTPGCDAILDAARFGNLPALIKLSAYARKVVGFSFGISILYNLAGLYFAMQGKMNPMIAAILMPASTITIVLLTVGMTGLAARYYGLRGKG